MTPPIEKTPTPRLRPRERDAASDTPRFHPVRPGPFEIGVAEKPVSRDRTHHFFFVCLFAMYPLAGAVTIVLAGLMLAGAGQST